MGKFIIFVAVLALLVNANNCFMYFTTNKMPEKFYLYPIMLFITLIFTYKLTTNTYITFLKILMLFVGLLSFYILFFGSK
ncbi:hypothetical protein Runsl_2463 [Runella slithyformis DSM 19594]|uniref:Uncharacterized protein n=1 Tax=Runella slithyformis (strain ATCC 29530 / DSM 19594 / LMG 11500 / NCIMB 11436 / LSU 4) TaxID=761193 RepID=A0A7U4E645_RUNSL|nr:hypothetical protein Runsl_2463 [Runella slithyformis DSM 19594]